MNLDKFVDRSEEKVNKYVDKVVNLKQKILRKKILNIYCYVEIRTM